MIQNSRWWTGGAINGGVVFMHGTSEIRYNEATFNGGGIGDAALEMHDFAKIHSNHAWYLVRRRWLLRRTRSIFKRHDV